MSAWSLAGKEVHVCRWVEGADKRIGIALVLVLALSLTVNSVNRNFEFRI